MSEKGFIPLISVVVIVLLIAGVGGGVYLATHPTILKSHASASNPIFSPSPSAVASANPYLQTTFTNSSGIVNTISVKQKVNSTGTYYNKGFHIYTDSNIATGISNNGYLIGYGSESIRENGANDSGYLRENIAYWGQAGNYSSTGTSNNVYVFKANPYYQSGTVNNLYGFFSQAGGTGGAVTNFYDFYGADSNASNFFAGNVGIGVPNPTSKLEVNGDIKTKGRIVDAGNISGADFVFEPDYTLKTLAEVEAYIKTNKHLPNVPSATDQSGWAALSLQEREMKLLEKIEELTLYNIQLEKRIQALEQK